MPRATETIDVHRKTPIPRGQGTTLATIGAIRHVHSLKQGASGAKRKLFWRLFGPTGDLAPHRKRVYSSSPSSSCSSVSSASTERKKCEKTHRAT